MWPKHGVGFYSMTPVDVPDTYNYELVMGRYHNYHFTHRNWAWPEEIKPLPQFTIDAFSPNLNKHLHVGHLRQLALAKAFSSLLPKSNFVAMLGESLGVLPEAKKELNEWFEFLDYHPTIYTDKLMVATNQVYNLVEIQNGEDCYEGAKVWQGPIGPVVVYRSTGGSTYALHDLVFAKVVKPDYYITGEEQKSHFESLGLEEKHLPMGLVLDAETGKKLKSRDGNALSAKDAMNMVIEKLQDTPHPKELAWNVLAWNFAHVSRTQNVSFDPVKWTQPDAPGMYISYTYARLVSALKKTTLTDWSKHNLKRIDIDLLGMGQYLEHWVNHSVKTMDFAGLANYVHEFARFIANAYHKESIKDGRPEFKFAMENAKNKLAKAMGCLGMFVLEEV